MRRSQHQLLLGKTKGSLSQFDPRRLGQCRLSSMAECSALSPGKGSHVPFSRTGVPCPCTELHLAVDRPTKQYLGKGDEDGCFLIIVLALNQGAPDIHQ